VSRINVLIKECGGKHLDLKKVTGQWRKFKQGTSYCVLNKYNHYTKVCEVGGACISHGRYKVLVGKNGGKDHDLFWWIILDQQDGRI
jgi:hypothetical protein